MGVKYKTFIFCINLKLQKQTFVLTILNQNSTLLIAHSQIFGCCPHPQNPNPHFLKLFDWTVQMHLQFLNQGESLGSRHLLPFILQAGWKGNHEGAVFSSHCYSVLLHLYNIKITQIFSYTLSAFSKAYCSLWKAVAYSVSWYFKSWKLPL